MCKGERCSVPGPVEQEQDRAASVHAERAYPCSVHGLCCRILSGRIRSDAFFFGGQFPCRRAARQRQACRRIALKNGISGIRTEYIEYI